MRKKRLYIFSLWIATMSVLLSTVMAHHHHMDRICMVVEQCQEDGNYNDEHTHHHENEQDGCRVHQMHQFFTNAKVMKSIEKQIFDGSHWLTTFHHTYLYDDTPGIRCVRWQQVAQALPSESVPLLSRRGPPAFVF